ncbi:hypothetical protein TNCV_3152331 [Trichonephila clavipes]|nr:hypothetical protein TNCV_3152331 [Trichonephila clavipes]
MYPMKKNFDFTDLTSSQQDTVEFKESDLLNIEQNDWDSSAVYGLVSIWYHTCFGRLTEPHIFRKGNSTAQRYADEIFRSHGITYALAVDDLLLLKQNKVRPYASRLVKNFLEADTIPQMEWPTRCPDLNSTEHVYNPIG